MYKTHQLFLDLSQNDILDNLKYYDNLKVRGSYQQHAFQ